jgi:hypothetical protein
MTFRDVRFSVTLLTTGVRFSVRAGNVLFATTNTLTPWPVQWVQRTLSAEIKRLKREAEYSPQSSAWSIMDRLPLRLNGGEALFRCPCQRVRKLVSGNVWRRCLRSTKLGTTCIVTAIESPIISNMSLMVSNFWGKICHWKRDPEILWFTLLVEALCYKPEGRGFSSR